MVQPRAFGNGSVIAGSTAKALSWASWLQRTTIVASENSPWSRMFCASASLDERVGHASLTSTMANDSRNVRNACLTMNLCIASDCTSARDSGRFGETTHVRSMSGFRHPTRQMSSRCSTRRESPDCVQAELWIVTDYEMGRRMNCSSVV